MMIMGEGGLLCYIQVNSGGNLIEYSKLKITIFKYIPQ